MNESDSIVWNGLHAANSYLVHEDEHLLVVNKPPGLNTHRPSPYAGEGIYDWLKHREARWSKLAIVHRLDKETSGILVFGKTALANRSLTDQFTSRVVRKKYLLWTDRPVENPEFTIRSRIARMGDRYASCPDGEIAETRFRVARAPLGASSLKFNCLEAEPITGRTHQIRVHAAENGFPILGDTLYSGSVFPRVCLHAAEISLRHPADGTERVFSASLEFVADPHRELRTHLINPTETNACRLIHGAFDGWPGLHIDRLGDFLLVQSALPLAGPELELAGEIAIELSLQGVYFKQLDAQVQRSSVSTASPSLISGSAAPDRFSIRENGLLYELSFNEGYSVGLFLDQRDNRRRLLTNHIGAQFPLFNPDALEGRPPEVLNAFAYTCGFSVAAAKGGARVTSLDLSRKYLDWGRRNFELNHIDPHDHDFIYGDVFDWFRRLSKKQRRFDVVLLDPPTFSRSKEHGVFRVEKDFGQLTSAALDLLRPGGVLFASSNAAGWKPELFLQSIEDALAEKECRAAQVLYVPQPPDFPIHRNEPAYLKTVWVRLES